MGGWGKKGSWDRDDHKLPKIASMRISLGTRIDGPGTLEIYHRFIETTPRNCCQNIGCDPDVSNDQGRIAIEIRTGTNSRIIFQGVL